MQVQTEIQKWLLEKGLGDITSTEPVGGGCIHHSQIIMTESGKSFFLKQNQQIPQDMFQKEARGLEALRISGGPIIPLVYLVGEQHLLLEDLKPAPRQKFFWPIFGRQLAMIHLEVSERFGFQDDNYIGGNPQQNTWNDNGYEFFRDHRIKSQLSFAQNSPLLKSRDFQLLERLMYKLPDLIPNQPASLLHGDLWSGNLISNGQGLPAVIDPAVYYGWAEADLAMTDLFGSYPLDFYSAYQEVRPLDPDYRSRYPLYNLYHLLNHLNLFGSGYLPQVREIISRFGT